jgi:hypothetical protein
MTDGFCAAEHAGQVVTVHVAGHTITIDLDGGDARTLLADRSATAAPG